MHFEATLGEVFPVETEQYWCHVKVVGSDMEAQILCLGQKNIPFGPSRRKWARVFCFFNKMFSWRQT